MRSRTLAISAGLVVTLTGTGTAQAPAGAPRHQAVFEQLGENQLVRVAGPGIGRQQGRLLEPAGKELILTSDSQPLRLPATSIDTIWTRGGSAGPGAIVGALIGGALGALAGTEFGEENAGSAENVLGMAGIGVIGGSLLGAVIGTTIGRWKRRYP